MGALVPHWMVLVETAMVEITEEATKLLVIRTLLKPYSYKLQLTMGLPGLPWRLVNAILDTGAGPNFIRKDAIPQFY